MSWWQTLMVSVVSGSAVALVTWLLSRPKITAETSLIEAQASKTLAETEKIRSELAQFRESQGSELRQISDTTKAALEATQSQLGLSRLISPETDNLTDEEQLALLRALSQQGSAASGRIPRSAVLKALSSAPSGDTIEVIRILQDRGLLKIDATGDAELTTLGMQAIANGIIK